MAGRDAFDKETAVGKKPGTAEDFDWEIDSEGTMTVTGSGRMPDRGGGNHAQSLWEDRKETIKAVRIGEGITEVGLRAFEGCTNLREVYLPSTLTRVRAYAFRACTALKTVEAGDKEFRYLYEKKEEKEQGAESAENLITESVEEAAQRVVFGDKAFYGTPWAAEHFGVLYCRDGILYTCFSDQESIRIPEGVHTIAMLAFRDVRAKVLILPESLDKIEDYAFTGAQFERVYVPHEKERIWIGKYEGSLPESVGKPKPARWKGGYVKVPCMYELALKKTKYKGFKKFAIRLKKPAVWEDGRKGIWGSRLVDVAASLKRRLMRGGVLIGIRWDEERRVESVKSFVWLEECGEYRETVIDEYLMYPVRLEDGRIEPFRDSTTYQETCQLQDGFADMNAEELIKMGAIRYPQPGMTEEWFWSEDRDDFEGPVEMALLEMWMGDHPGYMIDTMEENMEKDRCRLFVDF